MPTNFGKWIVGKTYYINNFDDKEFKKILLTCLENTEYFSKTYVRIKEETFLEVLCQPEYNENVQNIFKGIMYGNQKALKYINDVRYPVYYDFDDLQLQTIFGNCLAFSILATQKGRDQVCKSLCVRFSNNQNIFHLACLFKNSSILDALEKAFNMDEDPKIFSFLPEYVSQKDKFEKIPREYMKVC